MHYAMKENIIKEYKKINTYAGFKSILLSQNKKNSVNAIIF